MWLDLSKGQRVRLNPSHNCQVNIFSIFSPHIPFLVRKLGSLCTSISGPRSLTLTGQPIIGQHLDHVICLNQSERFIYQRVSEAAGGGGGDRGQVEPQARGLGPHFLINLFDFLSFFHFCLESICLGRYPFCLVMIC